ERGLFVARLHILAGAVHRLDYLIERDFMLAGLAHRHSRGINSFHRSHSVALNAGDLHESTDGIAGHAKVMFHADLSGVFDLRITTAERSNQSACCHRAGNPNLSLTTYFSS